MMELPLCEITIIANIKLSYPGMTCMQTIENSALQNSFNRFYKYVSKYYASDL